MASIGKYQRQDKLKNKLAKANVSIFMLADLWGITPPTARGRLNGHCPITIDQISQALDLCEKRTKRPAPTPA